MFEADGVGAQTTYTLEIAVSDGSIEDRANVVITINQVNEAPSLVISNHLPTLPENTNAAPASSVFVNNTLTATDPDGAFSGTFAIHDCTDALNPKNALPQCLFAIPSSTADILLNDDVPDADFDFDYEIKSQYYIGITVTDAGGLSGYGTVIVQLSDVNDAPVLSTSDTLTSVEYQAPKGRVVARLQATDEDMLNTGSTQEVSLAILSATTTGGVVDNDTWELADRNMITGTHTYVWDLRLKAETFDALPGSEWDLTLRASDNAASPMPSSTIGMKIRVGNDNVRPIFLTGINISVAENEDVGYLIAQISQLVKDGGQDSDPLSLFITVVNPTVNTDPLNYQPGQIKDAESSGMGFIANSSFAYTDGVPLLLQAKLDYERYSRFTLYATVRDDPTGRNPDFISKSADSNFAIQVTDVNEPPTFVQAPKDGIYRMEIPENSMKGVVVNTVPAKDPDADTVLAFQLNDTSIFNVSNKGGGDFNNGFNNVAEIFVLETTRLDFESDVTSFAVTIIASDGFTASAEAEAVISVTQVQEPPTLGNAITSVLEDATAWATWSYCLPFSDPEGYAGNAFYLVEAEWQAEDSLFVVDSKGCVRATRAFDYENQESFSVTVNVSDTSAGFSDTGVLTVQVLDAPDMTVTTMTPSTLPTRGGKILLNGTNMGPTPRKLAAIGSDSANESQVVHLNFTNPTSGLTVNYVAFGCIVVAANTAIECRLPEGVGADFTWTLEVADNRPSAFRSKVNQSVAFRYSDFSYEAPLVTSVYVPDGYELATKGGTRITITGENFGPLGLASSAIGVKYARGLSQMDLRSSPPGIVAVSCNVTRAHSEISCFGAPGIGTFLDFWVYNLAGSYSNALAGNATLGTVVSYEPPTLSNVEIADVNVGLTVSALPTKGNTRVKIIGNHFGPTCTAAAFEASLSRVTYGPLSATGYTSSACAVTKDDTEITCSTAPGTGVNHTWQVTRGDQTSPVSTQPGVFKTSYAAPSLLSVSGQSINSAETQGGLRITILGSNLGDSVKNALLGTENVRIRYGAPNTDRTGWYFCTDIAMVAASNAVSCIMASGVGGALSLSLSVDGQMSNVLENAVSYGPPVIISFSGPGSSAANTSGSELVIIQGRNFGPAGAEHIDAVRYGRNVNGQTQWLDAAACTVMQSHYTLHCHTVKGGGRNLKWKVTIADQNSTSPTTNYAPPSIDSVVSGGAGNLALVAKGGEPILIHGSNFGPVGSEILDAVTFGPQGLQYTALDCAVIRDSATISCTSPPGIGAGLRFYITVAGQTSSTTIATSNLISYALPKILATSTATIGTEGGEISFSGTNFGLAVQGLEAKAWFGTKALLAVAKTQSDMPAPDGRDSITVRIPELVDATMAMVNVSSMLEISSGTTTLLSDPVRLSYMPPRVDKVFTYEGETSALKLVVEGSNFCGSIACGGIDVYDTSAEKKPVAIARYVGDWTHSRIEFEIGVDKGSFQVKVGSSTHGFQMSPMMTFEHKSPVIDNKAELAAGLYSTKGGDVITIKGRYFRKENVEVWVGNTKSPNVVSVVQNLELGYHHYTVVALMPPGQGRDNKLRIVLPSEGAVASTESEYAAVNYKPPSHLVQSSHTFPTTGGSVTFIGVDLGLCAFLVVDGAVVSGTGASANGCTPVEDHVKVTLNVPDGDGRGHSMSVIIGDQLPEDWAVDDAQCEKGRGIATGGGGDFGWFSYASPVVTSISPATIDTSAKREMVIQGQNFGVAASGPPTVVLRRRVLDESACTCASKEETACLAGPGCTASVCCGDNKGCGCFADDCGCCAFETTCKVRSFNHTTILCEMQPGQGTDLEISVTVNGEVSGGRAGATPVAFSFMPPTILDMSPLSSPTRGGTVVTIVGTSFGSKDAIVEFLGDTSTSAQGSALADTIGPISLSAHNHTHISFVVPEGQGHDRRVRVTVGGQSTIYGAASFHYDAPSFTKIVQPEGCMTQVRTIACGSPTQGGFLLDFQGKNFGVRGGGAKVVVGGTMCCDSASKSCDSIFSLAPYTDCACCVKSQTHESIKVLAPSGIGSAAPTLLTYGNGYKGWNFNTEIAYDPPWINFAQPQAGNANGDVVTLHGINFGNISGGGDVSSIRIGNRTCANIRWAGVGTDEAVACDLRQDRAGTKSVEITVGGQVMFWGGDEWLKSGGHRIFRTDCPTHYFGKDGEPCFECPFVTDNDGVTVYDQKGDKQYTASCDQRGDPTRPEMVAKKGFYLMQVQRTCDKTGVVCMNATRDCAAGESCDFDGSTGEEYCNATLKELRTTCQYVLSCEPAEACDAGNVCSVIEEGTRDPVRTAHRLILEV